MRDSDSDAIRAQRASEGLRWEDGVEESMKSVPFEFVGQVTSACAMTEAGHVEGGTASRRHVSMCIYGSMLLSRSSTRLTYLEKQKAGLMRKSDSEVEGLKS